MNVHELIKLGSSKIRRDQVLLKEFVYHFGEAFGYVPDCAGCTFKTTFAKLKTFVNNNGKNINNKYVSIMKNYQIDIRQNSVIHTFVDPKTNKVKRSYGKNMTDEFAEQFLTHGTETQLEQRKKLFNHIPTIVEKPALNSTQNDDDGLNDVDLQALTRSNLEIMAKELGIEDPTKTNFRTKADLITKIKEIA